MTKTLAQTQKLDALIRKAAEGVFSSGIPIREAAERLYVQERELIDLFAPDWILQTVTAMVRKQRLKFQVPDDAQLLLGLKLPKQMVAKDGRKVARENATLRVLRQHRARVLKLKLAGVKDIDDAIAFLLPYSRQQKGITFGQALAKEAAGLGD